MTAGLRSWYRAAGLLVATGWLGAPVFAQTQPPVPAVQPAAKPPSPEMIAAQAAFEALPEAERKAIQSDLIWTGSYSGAVSGSFGPLTFRAINAIKATSRGAPDGILNPAERRALAQAAGAAREAAGFRVIVDERTGVRIGIPAKALPKRDATPSGGGRWQSEDGRVTLDTSSVPSGGDTLEALFEKATNSSVAGRKITYKLLRPDFFVVSGETATGKFYRRLASGPGGLRGFGIGYDKALAPSMDKLVIAIAGSFEPFPTAGGPALAPVGVASAQPPSSAPVAPPVAVKPTERLGVGIYVSGKHVLTAAGAVNQCQSLKVAGRGARVAASDEASGLAVLEFDGAGGKIPSLRSQALAEQESVVLISLSSVDGKRVPTVLPGQMQRIDSGLAVWAPLQPGQAGTPVFDRHGQFSGVVTALPSDKGLVAGVAPQRAYAIAPAQAVAGLLGKAGVTLAPVQSATNIVTTGGIAEQAGKMVVLVQCGL